MLKLYDVVRLRYDRDDLGIRSTFLGSVIDVLGNSEAYTVEFVDSTGETIEESIFTHFSESDLVLASIKTA